MECKTVIQKIEGKQKGGPHFLEGEEWVETLIRAFDE